MPKARNGHGNGSEIVGVPLNKSLHTEVRKSKNSLKPEAHVGQGSLRELVTYNSEGLCDNAYNLITRVEVLQTAYMRIKSEPGNMTPGSDKETLDGISEE